MGTNYYAVTVDDKLMEAAAYLRTGPSDFGLAIETLEAAAKKELHIGKSSAGWCFGLHVHPDDNIRSLIDWEEIFETCTIEDEYGRSVSKEEMVRIITDRMSDITETPTAGQLRRNYAELGPNGLLRHKIDGRHCISHGVGTWDYMVGDFS